MSSYTPLRIKLLNYLHYKPLVAVHEIPFPDVGHAQPAVARELRWMAEDGLAIGTPRPRDLFKNTGGNYKEWKNTDAGEAYLTEWSKKNIIT